MKRLLILSIFVMLSIILVSCKSDISQESELASSQAEEMSEESINESTSTEAESSKVSEEKKAWTEVEENIFDGTKTTTEYRDGENDYTVTVEKLNGDGTLLKKNVQTYVNTLLTYDEKVEYGENEEIVERVITHFDENGKKTNGERYFVNESIIQSAKYEYDNKENIASGDIKYTDLEGKLLASGKLSHEFIEVYKCCVERLTVYDTNGEPTHTETYAYMHGNVDYVYSDVKSTEDEVSITIEEFDGDRLKIYIFDDIRARLNIEDGLWLLRDMHESRVVIQFRLFDSGEVSITAHGMAYTLESAQERLAEVMTAVNDYRSSMFASNLNDSFPCSKGKTAINSFP